MPIVHQPSMRAEQSLRHGLQPDILVPPMACLTPRRCDAPSIASPSDAADCLPRHRVADRSCTAFVGDSRQRLRTQSEATVHQPALCGHKWFGHCGMRCCGGSPASRGCGARHPLSATPSNPSFAAAAKCAWQHVLTTAGANYSLLLHPSPATAEPPPAASAARSLRVRPSRSRYSSIATASSPAPTIAASEKPEEKYAASDFRSAGTAPSTLRERMQPSLLSPGSSRAGSRQRSSQSRRSRPATLPGGAGQRAAQRKADAHRRGPHATTRGPHASGRTRCSRALYRPGLAPRGSPAHHTCRTWRGKERPRAHGCLSEQESRVCRHRAAGRPYPVWDVRTGGDRCGCHCSATCATSRCRCSSVGRSGSCCVSRTVASAHAHRVLQPAATGSDGRVTRERELASRQEKRIFQTARREDFHQLLLA